MFKTFILGLILGLGGTVALAYYLPVVNQHREASLITFEANVGTTEVFHVNLPGDRILAGIHGPDRSYPAGLHWPEDQMFSGAQAELFKLRDRNDVVVGVASRISSGRGGAEEPIQWTLNLPARGTMFVLLNPAETGAGTRNGALHAGTRDFAKLSGSVLEQFSDNVSTSDAESTARIHLVTRLVGPQVPEE